MVKSIVLMGERRECRSGDLMITTTIQTMGRLGRNPHSPWCYPALLALIAGLAGPALADPFQLLSTLDPAQVPPAGGGGDSVVPIISPDGRYVLFASTANNLVSAGTNGPLPLLFPSRLNVFLRDRTNPTTSLVSVNLAGTGGCNGDCLPSRRTDGMCCLKAAPVTWSRATRTTPRTSSSAT